MTTRPRVTQGGARRRPYVGSTRLPMPVRMRRKAADDVNGRATDPSEPWRGPGAITAVLTIVGFLFYGWSYYLALAFYARVGVTPEYVGWSQIRAVARAAFAGGIIAVGVVLIGTVLGLGLALPGERPFRAVRRRLPKVIGFAGVKSERWAILQRGILVLVALFVAVDAFASATRSVVGSADRLLAVSNRNYFLTASVAGIDVAHGEAVWVDPLRGPQSVTRSTVALLGQANGTTVVFDLCVRRVLRLPTEAFYFDQGDVDDIGSGDIANGGPTSRVEFDRLRREYCEAAGRSVR